MKETENPWVTLSTEPKYENPWIRVREDKVLNPSGKNGIYGVVSFKNKAVGIVPVNEEGYTWLVGQYRYTLEEYSWEIPEGGSPIGKESVEDTAHRELLEETGLKAGKMTLIGRVHTSNSVTDEEAFIFLAQQLQQGESNPEETEKLSVQKVHLREALEMVMRSEITDSMSTYGIFKAARLLGL
jgi:8-oxo-dGTP pyrophosphatase MutT (NUDIX family)